MILSTACSVLSIMSFFMWSRHTSHSATQRTLSCSPSWETSAARGWGLELSTEVSQYAEKSPTFALTLTNPLGQYAACRQVSHFDVILLCLALWFLGVKVVVGAFSKIWLEALLGTLQTWNKVPLALDARILSQFYLVQTFSNIIIQ